MTITEKNHQNHSSTKKSVKNLSSSDKDGNGFFGKEMKNHRLHNLTEH